MEQARILLSNYLSGAETLRNTEKRMQSLNIRFTLIRGKGTVKVYLREGNKTEIVTL